MQIVRCALGVIQKKGNEVIDPRVQSFGPAEADFLSRHVSKVRGTTDASARSVFADAANTPTLLGSLLEEDGDDQLYESVSKTLQDALAAGMKTSTNAKDCVFAVVRACDQPGGDSHITLLKLDAVVEAAKMKLIKGQGVTFEVLKGLLPEPGKLQKALSWPDPRPTSEVIMLDTNVTSAQYFENAYQVRVSPKSTEAESELAEILHAHVPLQKLPAAVAAAADLAGPMDTVLSTLAKEYPELDASAGAAAASPRPAGIIRPNKVAARPLIWRADGVEVKVPPELAGRVTVAPLNDGWRISVDTVTEPRREPQTG